MVGRGATTGQPFPLGLAPGLRIVGARFIQPDTSDDCPISPEVLWALIGASVAAWAIILKLVGVL